MIKATIRNRRIELVAPDDLPDGTDVLIELTPIDRDKIGIDESEWRDDPAALTDWESWIQTFSPVDFTAEEAVRIAEFDEEMGRFNREAVRRQMDEWTER